MRVLILSCVMMCLAACASTSQPLTEATAAPTATPTPEPFDQALYDQGVAAYLAAYCGSCHALEAAESWGAFGPAHDEAALHAAERLNDPNYSGEATTVEEYLRESILNPLVYFTPTYAGSAHRMPAYTHLPEADIDAMVYMLAQQKG